MASRTRCWAAGLAVAAMMALPATSTAQGTTGGTSSQSYGQTSTENKSPRYHLDQAKQVLDELSRSAGISGSGTGSSTMGSGTTGSGTTGSGTTGSGTTGSTTGTTTGSQSGSMTSGSSGDLASHVTEIRRHFDQLDQAYERSRRETSTTGSSMGTTGTTGSGTTGSGTTSTGTQATAAEESWMTHYSRLNQVLDRLNVPKTSTATGTSGSMSGTTGSGTTGTGTTGGGGTTGSGTTGSGTTAGSGMTGTSSIDATAMARLREFRMHLDHFHAAAMAEASGRR